MSSREQVSFGCVMANAAFASLTSPFVSGGGAAGALWLVHLALVVWALGSSATHLFYWHRGSSVLSNLALAVFSGSSCWLLIIGAATTLFAFRADLD